MFPSGPDLCVEMKYVQFSIGLEKIGTVKSLDFLMEFKNSETTIQGIFSQIVISVTELV